MGVRKTVFFFFFCGLMNIWTLRSVSYTFMAGYKQNWSTIPAISSDIECYLEYQTQEGD